MIRLHPWSDRHVTDRTERVVATVGVLAIYLLILMAVLFVIHFATQSAGGANPRASEPMPRPVVIVSPWDGEFYAGEDRGAEPYVRVGSEVTADTVVAKIDAMKLLPIKAGVEGMIAEVLVTDGEMVEAGQPLFVVRPPLPPI